MDNTDRHNRTVIVQALKNNRTGEKIVRIKEKKEKRPVRKVIASGRGEKTVGKILIARLSPLRPYMVRGLQLHGINTMGLSMPRIVILYHNQFSPNKDIPVNDFIDNPVFKLRPSDTVNSDLTEARNQTAILTVNEVISEVMRIFAAAKKKYDNLMTLGYDPKELMSRDEYYQARSAKKVIHQLLKESEFNHYLKADQLMKWVKWAVVVWLIFYLLKKL